MLNIDLSLGKYENGKLIVVQYSCYANKTETFILLIIDDT